MKVSVYRRTVVVAALAAASMSLGMAAPSGAATAVSIGPTASQPDVPVSSLHKWQYTHNFWPGASDGAVTDVKVVNYPASLGVPPFMPMDESINIGADHLDATLRSLPPGEKTVVMCESQGCIAAAVLLKRYEADPSNAPDLSNVVFVGAGNPSVPSGLAAKAPGAYIPLVRATSPGGMPNTVTGYMFTREFDFFAYTPDDSDAALLNPVVAVNYAASFLTVHPFYGVVDPDNLPADTLVKQDGKMTYYVIPAKVAPVLIPAEAGMRALGLGDVFDQINQQMLDVIRPYYEKNRDGYVPLSSLSSTDPVQIGAPTTVPDSASKQLQGEDPGAGGQLVTLPHGAEGTTGRKPAVGTSHAKSGSAKSTSGSAGTAHKSSKSSSTGHSARSGASRSHAS
jgi:hypothetical protein